MSPETKIYEEQLYEIWEKQDYEGSLHTISGDEIEVLDLGVRNADTAGPDYRNARIRVGNLTFVGDIEIDCDYSDWKVHGHNIDSKYNKVIIHASLNNRNNHPYVYTRDGRKIPTICMKHFISSDTLDGLAEKKKTRSYGENHNLKCHQLSENVLKEEKEKFLSTLGIERFNKKCKKIYNRLKELKFIKELHIKEPVVSYELSSKFHERDFLHDDFKDREIWQQLLYELVFEALGYSKNKKIMMNLAQHSKVDYLNKIEKDGVLVDRYESVLFNISGLIPKAETIKEKETSDYVELLNLHWKSFNHLYDGEYLDEAQWHFFRLRPQNFPTIRIAAGARILNEILNNNLFGKITKKINEIRNLTILINSLRSLFVIKSGGYWRSHFIFDQRTGNEIKYFIGASRADEIIVNVVLPLFSIYYEVFGNPNQSKKILKMYDIFNQRSDNNLIVEVASSLGLTDDVKRTIIAQGMIELFRNYCSKNKCLECEIGKVVFN